MARFYAEIQGNRGSATRMGTPSSGIWGHVRGWHSGAQIVCDAKGDDDVTQVYLTSGSNGHGWNTHLATLVEHDGRRTVTVTTPNGPITWDLP